MQTNIYSEEATKVLSKLAIVLNDPHIEEIIGQEKMVDRLKGIGTQTYEISPMHQLIQDIYFDILDLDAKISTLETKMNNIQQALRNLSTSL